MVIAIASGKGGTGKTTFAVNLAQALAEAGETVRLLDCDVEEPNDHLFVKPEFTEETEVTVPKPVWHEDRCTGCGQCAEACNYNALVVVKGKVLLFNQLCHSCGVCAHICPEGAFTEREVAIGKVQAAPGNQPFYFAHGLLDIGEALAPSVVRGVKEHVDPAAINILDASPGTACPVVEAVSGADAALLVTEPTPFGLNDLKLAVGLTLKLGVPTGIIINRSQGEDRIIADYAEEVGLPIAGRIPFKRSYAEAYSGGHLLVDEDPQLREDLLRMYRDLQVATVPPPADELLSVDADGAAPFTVGKATSYQELTIISGKGGTGKTTVAASLAHLSGDKILADNDVDAADLHLILAPRVCEAQDFVGGTKAEIDADRCRGCGTCVEACHFGAIRRDGPVNDKGVATARIDPLLCEGCGLCPLVCPEGAIEGHDNTTGRWFVSSTDHGPMVHARLGIAEENSGRLVTCVRNHSAEMARDLKRGLVLADGPPGTGCPVIASVTGSDLVLVVTEPTVSGVHDLRRVLDLAAHFGVPALVAINKADLNREQARRIEALAAEYKTRVVGEIPFDPEVNEALVARQAVVAHGDGPAAQAIRGLWSALETELQRNTTA